MANVDVVRERRRYPDRRAAGELLADEVASVVGPVQCVVLGLPRGGVVVADPIADRLSCALDVVGVRKMSVPGRAEMAMGAVACVGDRMVEVRNDGVIRQVGVDERTIDRVRSECSDELRRAMPDWRRDREPPAIPHGATAVVVDDGLATGATARAAVTALRDLDIGTIVVAVPIGPSAVCAALEGEGVLVVCPWQPQPFLSVGQGYDNFEAVASSTVRGLVVERRAGR